MRLPYNIIKSEETGYYSFVTDLGFRYECAFSSINYKLSPVIGIYNIEVFEFDFSRYIFKSYLLNKNDDRVIHTIAKLLSDFFSTNLRILVYTCESLDEKHFSRQILFKKWHQNIPNETDIKQLDISIGVKGEEGFFAAHGGIVTRKDFPYPDILQAELIDKAKEMIFEKNGIDF